MTRIALVSNCLANQNAKVAEYEVTAGAIAPVLGLLREKGFRIQQMPCPEMTFMGCARWWQVKAQYDTPGYRRHCRMLAQSVADIVEGDGGNGCTDLVFLGVDGSPSSAVGVTDFGPTWGGRPEPRDVAYVPGRGVWTEVLLEVLAERGLPPPRMIGMGTELPGYDAAADLRRLAAFLAAADQTEAPLPRADARTGAPADESMTVRGRRILVLPAETMNDEALAAPLEAAGWGILQLPPAGLAAPARTFACELVADQIEDYRRHTHLVAALAGKTDAMLAAELARRGVEPLAELSGDEAAAISPRRPHGSGP